MKLRIPCLALGTLVVFASPAAGQQPQVAPNQPQQPDLAATASEVAARVFAEADTNHNRMLSRTEFQNAQALLLDAVEQVGNQGMLGHPKKRNPKDKKDADDEQAKESAAEASAARLAKSGRISQGQFAQFAHDVIEDADRFWRNARGVAEAQRKAYNEYRAYYRARRGRAVQPYRYPF